MVDRGRRSIASHLSGLQGHVLQSTVVVLDVQHPRARVVVVLMCDVQNGRDHVRVCLSDQMVSSVAM